MKSTTALTVFSATGVSLKKKSPNEKQFLSWLNVVPIIKYLEGRLYPAE